MLVKYMHFTAILDPKVQKTAAQRIIEKVQDKSRYLRFRAIGCLEKSGFNANADGFPYSEFEDDRPGYGYKSFVGKPAHVEHNSREGVFGRIGTVLDAFLNRFILPDGIQRWKDLSGYQNARKREEILSLPEQTDGSIEALMRIDAALLESPILNTQTRQRLQSIVAKLEAGHPLFCSMGCNAEYSICTVCGNKALFEKDYCDHIKNKLKGTLHITTANHLRDLLTKDIIRPEFLQWFVQSRYDINEVLNGFSNKGIAVKAAEINYGISFFELSVVAVPAFSRAELLEKVAFIRR